MSIALDESFFRTSLDLLRGTIVAVVVQLPVVPPPVSFSVSDNGDASISSSLFRKKKKQKMSVIIKAHTPVSRLRVK